MLNVNVNIGSTQACPGGVLGEAGGVTPRTPEILNSLIAMTNPLDSYQNGKSHTSAANHFSNSDSNSSTASSMTESSGAGGGGGRISYCPPSIQHTCSQLIKAGLKLSIEQKRKQYCSNHSDSDDHLLDLDRCKRIRKRQCHIEASESEDERKYTPAGLTPEDEERRRRRRERNKIAATKCRLKKREKTASLITEAEQLETQNIDLKNQLHELQSQKRELADMLTTHRTQCQQNITPLSDRVSLQRLIPSSTRKIVTTRQHSTSAVVGTNHHSTQHRSDDYHTSSLENCSTECSSTATVSHAFNNDEFHQSAFDSTSHNNIQFTNIDSYQCHGYATVNSYATGMA